jgi:hypothetical protein
VIRTKAALAVVGVTFIVTLATGCTRHPGAGGAGTPAQNHPVSSASIASAAPADDATGTAPADNATGTAAAASAAQVSTLAAVAADLAAIDTGTSKTEGELAAGDSARAQNDEG